MNFVEQIERVRRSGFLYEMSPFGTGFIEDATSGRIYGFHWSMLGRDPDCSRLEGAEVSFLVNASGEIQSVELAHDGIVPQPQRCPQR